MKEVAQYFQMLKVKNCPSQILQREIPKKILRKLKNKRRQLYCLNLNSNLSQRIQAPLEEQLQVFLITVMKYLGISNLLLTNVNENHICRQLNAQCLPP